jgi:hypothetical protein
MWLREILSGIRWARRLRGPMAGAIALALSFGLTAQPAQPVLQRGYDAGVSGANLAETTLNTSNVSPNTFGLVFTLPVDDNVFAQPLYVPNVAMPLQGTHNVVYVATMSDTLYAFDADVGGAPFWSVNFANLVGAMPVPIANWVFGGNRNIIGNLGILSTPVIDPSTNIMYLIACTLENNTLAYRLHAVDITTGMEPYGPGVLISGSYGGATFNARYQLQRVSLVLSGNQVVFGFSALGLEYAGGYVGWVMAYNKLTLQQSGVFATVTTGNRGGGVWQSGRPAAVDSSGYVYVFVGNAYGDGYDGINNFSESALKLDPANALGLVDWFTAGNWSYLDNDDLDLSSSGPLLIPGTSPSLLAGGGKTGDLYVLNTAKLGKFNAADSQVIQKENITGGGEIQGGPVYWQRSAANGGPLLYNWGAGDSVKAYPFNGTMFAAGPSARGSSSQIWPGGVLALSANGDQQGSGVLWATVATRGDAQNNPPVSGELHAFDAADVSRELWNSTMNASRDGFGNFAKFVPPLVANGRVYVATWSNQAAVYGLLTYTVSPTSLAFGSEMMKVSSAPMGVTVTNTGTVALPVTRIALSGANASQFSQTNTCGASLAVGSNCTISVVFTPTSAGSKTATLNVNGGGAAAQSVALSGSGVALSDAVSPTALDFGSETAGVASAPMSVTVTNTGTVALPITSIALSGTDAPQFSQTNTCGTSLTVGSNCTISVVFTPTSVGSKTAALNVNAGGAPALVPLSGLVPLKVSVNASAATVTAGTSVTLTWVATKGASCSATGGSATDGWGGGIAARGTQGITESTVGTYRYGVSCTAGSQTQQSNASVVVTWPVVSAAVTASPTTLSPGSATTITWTSTNATSCVASGGGANDGWASASRLKSGSAVITESGTVSAGQSATLVFTITCTSSASTLSASSSVSVVQVGPTPSGGGGGAFDSLSLVLLLSILALPRLRSRGSDLHPSLRYGIAEAQHELETISPADPRDGRCDRNADCMHGCH